MTPAGDCPRCGPRPCPDCLARRDRLVLDNLGLVGVVLRRFWRRGEAAGQLAPLGSRDDWEQEGRVALIRAAECYRPGRGAAFTTFACLVVANHFLHLIKAAGRARRSVRPWSLDALALGLRPDGRPGAWDTGGVGDALTDPDSVRAPPATDDELWEEVCRLPPRLRLVTIETYYGGRSGPEVGALLGVTRTRVHQLRRLALDHLRGRVL